MNFLEAKKNGYDSVYFTFDCIGDTLLLMTALEYLYKQNNKKILMGTLYKEIVENCPYIDLLDEFNESFFDFSMFQKIKSFGINPIFITATDFIQLNGQYYPRWGKYHMLLNMCNKLGISQNILLKTKIFLNEEEKASVKKNSVEQIAIVSSGYQKYKSIPFHVAQAIVNDLSSNYRIIQIGSSDDPLLDNVIDQRGIGVRKTATILSQSRLFIGGIGGLMHLSRAVDCRSVIAFSSAEPLAMENYICNINVFAPEPRCSICGDGKEFPYLVNCKNNYSCISGIQAKDIINAAKTQLQKSELALEAEVVCSHPEKVNGIEDFIKRFGKLKG